MSQPFVNSTWHIVSRPAGKFNGKKKGGLFVTPGGPRWNMLRKGSRKHG